MVGDPGAKFEPLPSGGTALAQASSAIGQRVRKGQPEGGFAGLGSSPFRMRSPSEPSPGCSEGVAASRAGLEFSAGATLRAKNFVSSGPRAFYLASVSSDNPR